MMERRSARGLWSAVREGTGDPIILLHGTCMDHRVWSPLLDLAGWTRPLVVVDLPGQGRSTPWPGEGPITHEETVAAVAELVAQSDGRCSVIGHSQGGLVAADLARRAPERVRDLVLVGLILPPDPPELRSGHHALNAQVAAAGQGVIADLLLELFVGRCCRDDPGRAGDIAAWRAWLAEPGPAVARAIAGVIDRPDLSGVGCGIACPTLAVFGLDDARVDAAAREATLAALPAARVELLDGVGHSPPLECPHRLLALIDRFWDPA